MVSSGFLKEALPLSAVYAMSGAVLLVGVLALTLALSKTEDPGLEHNG